jgi:hypothetical protein
MVTQEQYDALLKRVEALEGKVKRKTKLSGIFIPTDEHFDYAGFNQLSVTKELELFRLHHESKGTLSANWNSSFSTWLRNAVKFKRSSFSEQKKDDADRLLGRGIYEQGMNLTIRGNNGFLT